MAISISRMRSSIGFGELHVPPFINEGEKIRVDTSEGAYMSRA